MSQPIPAVNIANWHQAPKESEPRRYAKKTTPRTHILDPTGATGPTFIEISNIEPNRVRLIIQVIDAPCTLLTQMPRTSPDPASTIAAYPEGRYLPNSLSKEYIFYGQDAFFLNSLTGNPTRVTVTKEFK